MKPVSNLNLLLIGVTAGVIAVAFPRLLPYLFEADQSVTITFFTTRFIVVVTIFSLLLGAAMIWLYMGTKESTKNLFMSALALPAVLSGGMNMSSFSATAQATIADLNMQTVDLQNALEAQNNIEIEAFDFGAIQPTSVGFIPSVLGISTALAQEQDISRERADNTSVRIKALSLEQNFVLMLDSADDRKIIDEKSEELKQSGIGNLITYKKDDRFYLLQNERKTKTTALLDAIKIQEQHNLTPRIIEID